MTERLTDEQLLDWRDGRIDLYLAQCSVTALELIALRARVAELEAALTDAGVAMVDWHDGGYKLPHLIQRIDAVNAALED